MHNLSCENEFYLHENKICFPYQRLTLFETEARGNSELAYWPIIRALKQQRRRQLRKRQLQSEVALLQTSSRFSSISFNSSNAGIFFFFFEFNSKRLWRSSGKEKQSRCFVFTTKAFKKLKFVFHVVPCACRTSVTGKNRHGTSYNHSTY